jgi:AraC-like DNA-binding protein
MSTTRLETYTTAGLAPREGLSYWNRLMRATFDSAAVCAPLDEARFSAQMARLKLGDVQFVEMCSPATAVRHVDAPRAGSRKLYVLQLQLEGTSVKRQCGREAQLFPGDFTICDGNGAWRFESESRGPHRQLSIGIPKDLLRRYVGAPESILATRMCGTRGISGLASATVTDFWRRCRAEPDSMQRSRVVHALLELIAVAYARLPQVQASTLSKATLLHSRVVAYIEAHLHEPDLGPRTIAGAMRMSTRSLHYAFDGEDETVGRYIRRRRLEESARAIVSAPLRGRTLTAIAADLGFDSATHFGRAFREHFGVTPREYRRRKPSQI